MSRYLASYLSCTFAILVFCASAAAQGTSVQLTVVKPAGAPAGDPSFYHFRPEEADSGQGISHVFVLENDTGKPVKIARVDASCSCTTAVLQPGSSGESVDSGNVVLAPGQQIDLKVTVGIGDAAAGDLEKAVWVHVAGQIDPAATLHITGTIDPPVMFVPETLDFGSVSSGKLHMLTFRIGFSPRAQTAGMTYLGIRLDTQMPSLQIAPMGGNITAPRDGFPENYRVFLFVAMLPANAPDGPIDGAITYEGTMSAAQLSAPAGNALVLGAGAPTAQVVAPASLPPASLRLEGTVSGDLSARPSTAIFGTVAAGRAASVQMTVSSASGQNLAGMSFTGDQPWLSAKVVGPAATPGTWTIRLTIAATAPAGAQNAHLIGAAPSGGRLVIPVMAYIVAEGP